LLPYEQVCERHPWLRECEQIAKREAFFHWELEHAPVFQRGGFDLQVGNPPWTKLTRTDTDVLTDAEPTWAFNGPPREPKEEARERSRLLAYDETRSAFFIEAGRSAGTGNLLSSPQLYPATGHLLTNLYLTFMERMYQLDGLVCGLLHQESFYEDEKADELREKTYRRLRQHWHFLNEGNLFEEVHNETEFGVHITGQQRSHVHHLYCANALQPFTIDQSLQRLELGEYGGEVPGKKNSNGDWDTRPHAQRIIHVDDASLTVFAAVTGDHGMTHGYPRPLRIYGELELPVLRNLTEDARTVGSVSAEFSSGLHESTTARPGRNQLIEKRVAKPEDLSHAIFKGPNVNTATPFYQQANESYNHSKDNEILDLRSLPDTFIPRTVLQTTASATAIAAYLAEKDGWQSTNAWRQMWPEHISRGWVRVYQPALIPPGVIHGHSCMSMTARDHRTLAMLHALSCSIIYEYLLRVMGTDHVGASEVSSLPFPADNGNHLSDALILRVLRLNCLTSAYENLWTSLYSSSWTEDSPAGPPDDRLPSYHHLTARWSPQVPIRIEYARWRTIVEIDALSTIIFGLDPSDVEQAARLHLGLSERYERLTAYDARGRKLSGEFHNRGAGQQSTEMYKLATTCSPDNPLPEELEAYNAPFDRPDRWNLYQLACEEFNLRSTSSRRQHSELHTVSDTIGPSSGDVPPEAITP
jgi:hypothetical protein